VIGQKSATGGQYTKALSELASDSSVSKSDAIPNGREEAKVNRKEKWVEDRRTTWQVAPWRTTIHRHNPPGQGKTVIVPPRGCWSNEFSSQDPATGHGGEDC